MKNILYIGKYLGVIGGIERYMQKSAELLRQNGFNLHYLYTDSEVKNSEEFLSSFDSIEFFSQDCRWLKEADLVVLHNIIPVQLLKLLPQNKTVFFAHDHNIYCRRHHYYTPIGRKNCHRKYNFLRCMFCDLKRNSAPPLAEYCKLPALVLSDFMRENLLKNGFQKVVKISPFVKVKSEEHIFAPNKVLRLLFLGQLIRGKGADLMLKSLAELDVPFVCTIAGDGNDRTMLENMVKQLQLEDKVKFVGFVNDTEKLWTNCDVFLFPIRWQEPFGLVAIEAMAHGLPIVAYNLGGVGEYLSDRNGVLVAEKQSFAPALKKLYNSVETMNKMGKNSLEIVKEKFSEERFIEEFKALQEVLK